MIAAERCIVEAMIRALTWRDVKLATDMGTIVFRDLGGATLVADVEGVLFDVAIVITSRSSE